jgi:soluble lytic murein transglycosylase
MSARPIPTRAAAQRRSRQLFRRRRRRRRRRLSFAIGVLLLAALAVAVVVPRLPDVVRELALPLAHEDIIRQQADAKELDPSLLAAVIYAESRFTDATSKAGARGLMQITPETAHYIARLSGGTAFEQGDLSTPQVNISYGAYYLRYLLRRYDQNTVLALAAYNGGEGNVDRWLAQASGSQRAFGKDQIPFTETREYVDRVLDARLSYREKYSRELGLERRPGGGP